MKTKLPILLAVALALVAFTVTAYGEVVMSTRGCYGTKTLDSLNALVSAFTRDREIGSKVRKQLTDSGQAYMVLKGSKWRRVNDSVLNNWIKLQSVDNSGLVVFCEYIDRGPQYNFKPLKELGPSEKPGEKESQCISRYNRDITIYSQNVAHGRYLHCSDVAQEDSKK